MSDYTNYAQFNTFTVTGRITFSEVRTGKYGEFVSVSLISTLVRDGQEVDVVFTDNNGLVRLAQAGHLPAGRIVTVTGRIAGMSETYTNKDGELQMRKRARLELEQVQILNGGLGPAPSDKKAAPATRRNLRPSQAQVQAPVDQAPAVEEAVEQLW